MVGAHEEHEGHSDSELRAFRTQLSALAQTAKEYPFEYSLGDYELLFESRDDIQIIVENLDESLAESQDIA